MKSRILTRSPSFILYHFPIFQILLCHSLWIILFHFVCHHSILLHISFHQAIPWFPIRVDDHLWIHQYISSYLSMSWCLGLPSYYLPTSRCIVYLHPIYIVLSHEDYFGGNHHYRNYHLSRWIFLFLLSFQTCNNHHIMSHQPRLQYLFHAIYPPSNLQHICYRCYAYRYRNHLLYHLSIGLHRHRLWRGSIDRDLKQYLLSKNHHILIHLAIFGFLYHPFS